MILLFILAQSALEGKPLVGVSRSVQATDEGATRVNVPFLKGEALVTCVVLPEESVKAVVAAWDESEISIEHNGPRLFVKLLAASRGYVDAVGGSGKLYRLLVMPVTSGTYDETLTVKNKPEAKAAAPRTRAVRSEALDLILAMRRGERPDGVTICKGPAEPVYKGQAMTAWFRHVYHSDRFIGVVAAVQNVSDKTLALDLSRFGQPRLVLVGAKEFSIKPGESTLVYLVLDSEEK